MPHRAWSDKRERRYKHINEAKQRGIKGRSRTNKAQLEKVLSR